MSYPDDLTRRSFLGTSSLAAVAAVLDNSAKAEEQLAGTSVEKSKPTRRPRVAAINSIFRFRSHAYHIVGRFVHGYTKDGLHHQPPFEVVRMYNDQAPKDDLSKQFCETHKIQLCQTVAEALGGDKGPDVDAVLLVIEHGDYPLNEFGQILYPRFELFEQIMQIFRKSGRSVPVFVDKALSYDHKKAAKMVELSRELKFPMMAGSSLPVTWRIPEIEPPLGTKFTEGLAVIGYDRGPAEIFLFHVLEVLQCMLERRPGGETGVKSVQCLEGNAVWKAADEGRWSWNLLEECLARSPSANVGPVRENVLKPQAILIEYKDGIRGTVLNLIEQTSDFAFAGKVAGIEKPLATCFFLPNPPGAKFFDPLTNNIEKLFGIGKSPYPVERTLLTSTILDIALHSLHEGQKSITSPALDIRYQPPESTGFFRGRFVDAG